jgi:hypothetical protein
MRTAVYFLISGMMILSTCKKDDFQYSFETPSKLLVSIKEDGQLVTEFKYDSLNRVIQADRYLPGVPSVISQFFEYDSNRRLICKTSGEYTENYEYNSSGSLGAIILHFMSSGDGYEWEQRTEFQYSKGRISKGVILSRDGVESGYFYYKYDSRGNTIERTEYSVSADYKGLIISQCKFNYDENINPNPISVSPFWGLSQSDIIQGNNPTYSYYYSITMSSLPPQFQYSYDYDDEGLPLKEYRASLPGPGSSNIYEYEYAARIE